MSDSGGTRNLYFNPRSREGSDYLIGRVDHHLYISIHAPVKGATDDFWTVLPQVQISIHAPVKGATSSKSSSIRFSTISIHAPVKGATGGGQLDRVDILISIHAPVKGATMYGDDRQGRTVEFQSTLP